MKKKKNKKGFTLVELLAVIVILGVISTIAVLSVNGINRSVKERQYKNLIKSIEAASLKLYNDTKVSKFTVQSLIDEGYIEADNNTGKIYRQTDNQEINCKYIEADSKKASVVEPDAKNTNENSDCDYNIKEHTDLVICLDEAKDGCITYPSEDIIWLNDDSKRLYPYIKNENAIPDAFSWVTLAAPDDVINAQNIEVRDLSGGNDVYNQNYTVSGIINGKTYSRSFDLKVDKVLPEVELNVADATEWKTKKTISFTLNDKDSKIYEYEIISPNNETIKKEKKINKNEITFDYDAQINGTYKVKVYDYAKNMTTKEISVEKIDNKINSDSCNIYDNYSGNSKYTNSRYQIICGCKADVGGSGCKNDIEKTFEVKENVEEQDDISCTIYDNAGNSIECKAKDTNGEGTGKYKLPAIYDGTKPTCNISGANSSWTKSDKTITYYCTDSGTGCTDAQSHTKSINYSIEALNLNTTFYDNAGNSVTCPNVSVYVDKEGPTYSSGSASSSGASANYTDSYSGVKEKYFYYSTLKSTPGFGSTTTEVKTNGWTTSTTGPSTCETTFYVYTYAVDNVGNNSSVTYIGSYSTGSCCTTGSWKYYTCTSKGYEQYRRTNSCEASGYEYETRTTSCTSDESCGSYSSCSATCGGGTKTRTCTYYVGGTKKSRTDSATCNTQSCCSTSYTVTINGDRYDGCDKVYITSCQDSCNSNPKCMDSSGSTHYRSNLRTSACSPSPSNICSISDTTLFGTSKGSISGNYGDWTSVKFTCNEGCTVSGGYSRKCASSSCGDYKGKTAAQINSAAGCSFSKYWCSC